VAANLLLLAVVGVVFNWVAFRGAHSAFIMEMPFYHVPNARTVGLYVWHNSQHFVRKAGTLILIASIAVWVLSNLPGNSVDQSVLAYVGRWLEPAGRLLGIGDWRMIMSLLTSFVAKENVIATLGILYGGSAGQGGLAGVVATTLTPAARLAFLVVTMLFIPCLATTSAIRQGTGSWRWMALSLGLLLAISVGAGILVFQVGRWL
jgi:ferrous iron transport protein B